MPLSVELVRDLVVAQIRDDLAGFAFVEVGIEARVGDVLCTHPTSEDDADDGAGYSAEQHHDLTGGHRARRTSEMFFEIRP